MFQNYGNPTRVTRLKVAPNMADPTSMKHSVSNLKTIHELGGWFNLYSGTLVKRFLNYGRSVKECLIQLVNEKVPVSQGSQ